MDDPRLAQMPGSLRFGEGTTHQGLDNFFSKELILFV